MKCNTSQDSRFKVAQRHVLCGLHLHNIQCSSQFRNVKLINTRRKSQLKARPGHINTTEIQTLYT